MNDFLRAAGARKRLTPREKRCGDTLIGHPKTLVFLV